MRRNRPAEACTTRHKWAPGAGSALNPQCKHMIRTHSPIGVFAIGTAAFGTAVKSAYCRCSEMVGLLESEIPARFAGFQDFKAQLKIGLFNHVDLLAEQFA